MRTASVLTAIALTCFGLVSVSSGCGSNSSGASGGSGSSHSGSGSSGSNGGSGGNGSSGTGCMGIICTGGGGITCAAGTGKACITQCPGGMTTTTISGTVYDPAGKNPIWGVAVYVPSTSLSVLPEGVSCNGCADLYSGVPIAAAVTDAAGHFSIPNAPDATNVPLVVQIGKWRKLYTIPTVVKCQDNGAPMKLTLPSKNDPNDPTVGEIPNIAIATGALDSIECLLRRIGVDDSEFTSDPAGKNPTGQIKIFPGYNGPSMPGPGAVPSQQLWDSVPDLKRFDVVLLSCEGRETVDGPTAGATALMDSDRQNLLDYANSGGKVFASHYHYAWFNTGPFNNATNPPMASWLTGSNSIDDGRSFPGVVVQKLANGMPFPEGVAMQKWLGNVGALNMASKLDIFQTRHNVASLNAAPGVQAWITLDPSAPVPNTTEYFSIDAPIGAVSSESACGRVVYSDLHVSGGPGMGVAGMAPDYPTSGVTVVPSGCAMHDLTPQEKALEFMLFDLSSCLVPIGHDAPVPMIH